MYDEKKLLGVIGLCRGAGKAVLGVPMICERLREIYEKRGEVADVIVIEASDTSDNTHKKITDKCSFYGVKCIKLKLSSSEIGDIIGKSGAVCTLGITDKNFAGELIRLHLTINEETR